MAKKAKAPGGKWAEQVPDFARRIGEAARARRVVLFGSAARGDMREGSDLDFLVVVPDRVRPRDAEKRAWTALRGTPYWTAVGVDIVAEREERIRRLRDCPYGYIKFAMDDGVEVWRAGQK